MNGGQTALRQLAPGTASGVAWAYSKGRKALAIAGVQNGQLTFSPTNPAVDGVGLVVQQGQPPVLLSRDLHG